MKRFVRMAFTAAMLWSVLTPVPATPSDAREVDGLHSTLTGLRRLLLTVFIPVIS